MSGEQSRLDQIRELFGKIPNRERGCQCDQCKAARLLLVVVDAVLGGATLKRAIALFTDLAQDVGDEYWHEYFGRMRDALKELT